MTFKWIASGIATLATGLGFLVLDGISTDLREIRTSMQTIERHVGEMNGDLKVARSQIVQHEKRLDRMESEAPVP